VKGSGFEVTKAGRMGHPLLSCNPCDTFPFLTIDIITLYHTDFYASKSGVQEVTRPSPSGSSTKTQKEKDSSHCWTKRGSQRKEKVSWDKSN